MSTVQTAAESLGGPAALAKLLHVSAPSVHQWMTGVRPLPLGRCPAIERATAGKVTVEQLRPDVVWHRVPDPDWPHEGGRPCIDVAAPAREEVRDAA